MKNFMYEYSQMLMGTTVTLSVFEENKAVIQKVFSTIRLLEDKLTVNRSDSEVMSINKAAGQHPVAVSHFIFSLIEQAKQVSLYPDSCFNVAIGNLVKLWKIGFSGSTIPFDKEIQKYLLLSDPNKIHLDPQTDTVFLEKAEMEIDLGAIAKGYIADVVKAILKNNIISQAIINLGGNVLTLGSSPLSNNGYWHVGLKKPFATENKLLGLIKVKDKSVVTSGIYERFFIQNDLIYHHILNPKTGYPLNNELESVTVISDTSLEGDIYSTYFYGLGVKKSQLYLQIHLQIAAIFVTKTKKIILVNWSEHHFDLLDTEYELNFT